MFVPLTLPGEQARVRIVEEKRGYATCRGRKRLLRRGAIALRPDAGTLACAEAASISTRITKRNSNSSRRSCARHWNAAA